MRLTVMSHLTLDGVMQSNGKPEPELTDGFRHGGWQVPTSTGPRANPSTDWPSPSKKAMSSRTRSPARLASSAGSTIR